MHISRILPRFVLSLAGLFMITSLKADTLLDTHFSENNQRPPENLRWMPSGSEFETNAMISLTPTNNQREVVAYFDPVTIPEGHTLSLQFTLSVTNPKNAGSGLRVGLLNSQGGPKAKKPNFEPLFQTYEGYVVVMNIRSASPESGKIFPRDPGRNIPDLIQNNDAFGPPLVSGVGANISQNGVTYDGTLRITNHGAKGVEIRWNLGDQELTSTDTKFNFITFDAIAFGFRKTAGDKIAFHSMKLEVN